jgi:hypothetical protein
VKQGLLEVGNVKSRMDASLFITFTDCCNNQTLDSGISIITKKLETFLDLVENSRAKHSVLRWENSLDQSSYFASADFFTCFTLMLVDCQDHSSYCCFDFDSIKVEMQGKLATIWP